jgi:hypothetical protein
MRKHRARNIEVSPLISRSRVRAKARPRDKRYALALGMTAFAGQFFSRYPVLKIHHTTIMQMTRNASVMPTLKVTLTSAIS